MDRNRMDRRRSEYRRTVGTSRLTPEQRAAERRQAARRNRAARGGNDVLDRRMNAARMRAAENARRASRANSAYRSTYSGAGRQRAGSDRLAGRAVPRSANRPSAYSTRGRGSVPATRDIHSGASRNAARKKLDAKAVGKRFNLPKPPIRKMTSATMDGASAAVDFLRRSVADPIGGAVSSKMGNRKDRKVQAAALASNISGRFSGISRRLGRLGTEVPDSTDDLVFCDRLPVMFYKMVASVFVAAVFGFCLVSWVMPDKDFSAE